MPRERSPSRDQAFAIYLEHCGKIANREIAKQLGVPEKSISGWKVKDRWVEQMNGVLQTEDRSTPTRIGAPRGNRNAAGHGARPGNKNAVGNSGGPGGPPRNKKAVKTGEYETIWLDALEDDERDLVRRIDTDPMVQLDEAITLLSIRERRMMLRIKRLMDGLTEKQRRVLQERRNLKEAVPASIGPGGKSTTVVRDNYQMVTTEVEDTEFRTIDDIMKLEEVLTRIQDKKLKAIEFKRRHEDPDDTDTEDDGFLDALKCRGNEVWSDGDDDDGEET